MIIKNVHWTNFVNVLTVQCDCGNLFDWQTRISLMECPECHYKEWWHEYSGSDRSNYRVAKNEVLPTKSTR